MGNLLNADAFHLYVELDQYCLALSNIKVLF